jgi:Alpha/beta hydrolase family
MQTMTRTTFVLIPGAGTNPAVWQWTIAEMRSLGHDALAPSLPLDDPQAGPTQHADAACAAIADAQGPIVAVGQSLGAFAATLVAARVAAVALVLVAPMIPAPGETAGEWWTATGHAAAIAVRLARLGPMGTWGLDAIREVFLHDVPEDVAHASARFTGAPGPGMFSEPFPLDAWPAVPTRVLAPRDDRLFPLSFQRRIARERLGLDVEEMPGGHLPMLARPRELAVRLLRSSAPA